MPKISKNIKKFRAEKNLTQDALAEKMHVTRQAISNWENDKTKPDIEALEQLAEALDVEMEELIYGEKKEQVVSQDKTKEKNRIKIILAIIGSLFVASGLALVFFGFWQDFPLPLKTGFSVLPMLIGQGFAVYTYLKKKDSLHWRESASIIWTVGVVATIALIDGIYDISFDYVDYLVVDSFLIIPIMFVFGAVAPLLFYLYMCVHIAVSGDFAYFMISILLFATGVFFTWFIARNKEDTRGKYVQWITALASVVLVVVYTVALMRENLIQGELSVIAVILISYFVCMFIVSSEKFILPYKPISIIGLCIAMLMLSMGGISSSPDLDDGVLSALLPFAVCLSVPIVMSIFKRADFEDDFGRTGIVASPIVMIGLALAFVFLKELPDEQASEMVYGIFPYIASAATIAFGAALVYWGVGELRLFVINLGLITIFIQIMQVYIRLSTPNIIVLGVMLAVFGGAIIAINKKMLSVKKEAKEQAKGGSENA